MTSSEDQLCLNISSNSSPSFKKNKPPSSKERWAAKNQRAQEWSMRSKGPDNKKRKLDDEPAPPPDEQPDKPPPKKREKRREEKKNEPGRGSGIKTSSLFKHNPEIPEIQRPDVAQLKEQIFTTDSFSDLDLHPHLVATLNKVLNVSTVTSVQKQTIPVLMSGRDAVVRSQTGSGKTLSYAVPMVQSLQSVQPKISRSDGPLALVIVPTRELAQQTFTTFQKLLKPFTYIVPGVLMGGEKRKAEKARLRKGINILISTPGRLVDHIKNTLSIAFSSVQWLVLDEADRILDLGFEKDLTVILNSLNSTGPSRQNVLLSATLTHGVSHLAEVCLTDPVNIHVSAGPSPSPSDITTGSGDITASLSQSEGFAVPEALQQYVVVVPSKVRLVCLAAFILDKCKFSQKNKVIVFVSSCEVVEFLHSLLSSVLAKPKPSANQSAASVLAKPSANHNAPLSFLRLHGNMKQEERSEVFKEFSKSHSGVLLCTDVAARGLDLHQVTWILQYTPPSSVTEYVHRVGRTARIGETGSSLLFLTPSETAFISELGKHNISLSDMKLQLILSSLMTDETYKGRGKYHSKSSPAALEQETRERATVLQTAFEDFVHSDSQSLETAKKALQSFLRAYTTYPSSLKHIFHIKSLHLGHTAKSFGLRDAPQGLNTGAQGRGGVQGNKGGTTTGQKNKKNQTGKRFSHQEVSEFSSGLEALHAKKKQKKKSKMESAGEEE